MFLYGGEHAVSDAPEVRPLSNAKRTIVADLATRRGRRRRGRYLLEGPRAIEDAAAAGARLEWVVTTGELEERAAGWIESGRLDPTTRIYRVGEEELAGLADTSTPQGVIAVGTLPPSDLAALPAEPGHPVLVVDGVQDPGNLGTLLRTLAAVGGRTAIALRGTVDPWNPKTLRGAAGLTPRLEIAAGVDADAGLAWCVERGMSLVALSARGSDLFARGDLADPVALVVGHETRGVSTVVRNAATQSASIPMAAGVDSLSAAVAGSVALYVIAHRLAPEELP